MAGESRKTETPTKTPSEMMANAKVQVSGATTDVVNAVKSYGKPEGDSGVGHYVGKAEDYLHQLHSHSDQPQPQPQPQPAEKNKDEPTVVVAAEGPEKKAESAAVEGGEKKDESTAAAAGGVGGLINKAKGLFK